MPRVLGTLGEARPSEVSESVSRGVIDSAFDSAKIKTAYPGIDCGTSCDSREAPRKASDAFCCPECDAATMSQLGRVDEADT